MDILNKAVFLDRDGTINFDSKDYIKSVNEFHIFPYAVEALNIIKDLGYLLIVITNQSGVGRKFLSLEELRNIHNKLLRQMKKNDVEISDIYFCTHLPEENCNCRKPKLGNLEIAQKEHNLDLKQSWFIGDSEKDIITGFKASCRTILLLSGIRGIQKNTVTTWQIKPDYIAENLLDAAKIIMKLEEE